MEFLRGVISDELFDRLQTELKDKSDIKLANLATGNYVDVNKYNNKETEANGYKKQLEELNKSLNDMKNSAKGNEELQTKFNELQKKYNDDTQALESKIKTNTFNNLLELALIKAGAKSTKAVKGVLDSEKLQLNEDGNEIVGLKEQLETIVKEQDYLFNTVNTGNTGLNHQGGNSSTLSGVEQEFYKINPGLKDK